MFKIGDTVRLKGESNRKGNWKIKNIKAGLLYLIPLNHNGYTFSSSSDGTYPFGQESFELVKQKKNHLPDWL